MMLMQIGAGVLLPDCKPATHGNQTKVRLAGRLWGVSGGPSKKEVERSSKEPPDEFPFACGDRVRGGEEIHQGEKHP
jgi:hypothetical protein